MEEKKKYVLSISMLMCGRADTEKCLKSLMPFMEQLSCEIIVVDTGCDKDTRAIIEKYTDHIIPFTWCKDFSKARNAGLKEASGEWFLYLDDDEWFEDPTEIIDFFKSGEYKNYKSACYLQRNYSDYNESGYSDATVSRMIKLEKDTCFVSSIHEYLWPLCAPVKLFDAYVKHFGYIFKTAKEKYEHSKRNVDLLLDMMKKEPMNFRWDTHILQEYWGIGELSKVIEVAANGIAKYYKNNNKSHADNRSLGTFYGYLAEGYGRKFDFEREKKAIEDGLRDKNITKLAKAFLYKAAVYLNYSKEKYESCVEAYEHYMETYSRIGKDKNAIYEQGGLLIGDTFQKGKVEDAALHGIMAAAKIGRDDIIERDFYLLGWKDKIMLLHPDFQGIVIRRMVETPCSDAHAAMAKTMAERENNISSVVQVLREIEEECKKASDAEDAQKTLLPKDKWNNVIGLFSKVESEHWYITYLKLLKASRDNEDDMILPLFDKLCSNVFDIFNLNKSLWEIAEHYDVPMEPFFLRIDFDTWRDGITRWIMNTDEEDLKYKENLVKKWKCRNDIRYDFFFMKVKEGQILTAPPDKYKFEEYEQLMLDFAESELEFYGSFYKKKTMQSYAEVLPHECRIALKLQNIINERRKTGGRTALELIKASIDIYPPMNPVIKAYIVKVGEYLKEPESGRRDEMKELAKKLKENALELAGQGKRDEALDILKQLQVHFPKDKELETMMNNIADK